MNKIILLLLSNISPFLKNQTSNCPSYNMYILTYIQKLLKQTSFYRFIDIQFMFIGVHWSSFFLWLSINDVASFSWLSDPSTFLSASGGTCSCFFTLLLSGHLSIVFYRLSFFIFASVFGQFWCCIKLESWIPLECEGCQQNQGLTLHRVF